MNQMDDLLLPTPWVFPYPDREMYSKEQMLEYAKKAVEPLLQASTQTLEENGHLADGDNCTLLVLRNAISKYVTLDKISK